MNLEIVYIGGDHLADRRRAVHRENRGRPHQKLATIENIEALQEPEQN